MNKIKNFLTSNQFFFTAIAFFCMVIIIASMFSGNIIVKLGILVFFGSLYSAIIYVADSEEEVSAPLIMLITFPMIILGGMTVLFPEFEKNTKTGKLTFLHAWVVGAGALTLLFSFLGLLSFL